MNTNEQVRDFFRKMAEGSVIQANKSSELLVLLHNSHAIRSRHVTDNSGYFAESKAVSNNDFGVGLPPLANC